MTICTLIINVKMREIIKCTKSKISCSKLCKSMPQEFSLENGELGSKLTRTWTMKGSQSTSKWTSKLDSSLEAIPVTVWHGWTKWDHPPRPGTKDSQRPAGTELLLNWLLYWNSCLINFTCFTNQSSSTSQEWI